MLCPSMLAVDMRGSCCTGTGQPIGHGLFNAWWVRARDDVGLEGMRFHDLRHGFASALISAGCSVKAVQRALGHASASTTLDVSSHLWPGDEDLIRAAVDRALGPAEDQLRTVRPLRWPLVLVTGV
jgi:integrase